MPTAPARPMPMKAVGMAAPALLLSELLSEPEFEPEPEPEPLVEEEPEPVLVVEPIALERLELRLELELDAEVPLPPMKVPLGATETGTEPLMRVPVPMTTGAVVVRGELEVALAMAEALLTSEEAAEVREERPARSVGTR